MGWWFADVVPDVSTREKWASAAGVCIGLLLLAWLLVSWNRGGAHRLALCFNLALFGPQSIGWQGRGGTSGLGAAPPAAAPAPAPPGVIINTGPHVSAPRLPPSESSSVIDLGPLDHSSSLPLVAQLVTPPPLPSPPRYSNIYPQLTTRR